MLYSIDISAIFYCLAEEESIFSQKTNIVHKKISSQNLNYIVLSYSSTILEKDGGQDHS